LGTKYEALGIDFCSNECFSWFFTQRDDVFLHAKYEALGIDYCSNEYFSWFLTQREDLDFHTPNLFCSVLSNRFLDRINILIDVSVDTMIFKHIDPDNYLYFVEMF
jgi:hypothetical protein